MGNKNYWYLLSLKHLLEPNSLKESTTEQLPNVNLTDSTRNIFLTECTLSLQSQLSYKLFKSPCWSSHSVLSHYALWPTEHNMFKNPVGNYHCKTSVLALQLARPTLGFQDRKQLTAIRKNNFLLHLMDFSNDSMQVWFAHLVRSVARLLYNYKLSFSICILFF